MQKRKRSTRVFTQLDLDWKTWGGSRKGAGRKRRRLSRVSHERRAKLRRSYPLLITSKLIEGLPTLRNRKAGRLLFGILRERCELAGFRIVQFSILSNHLHLLVEADSRDALTRGLRSLFIRMAKNLNRLWGRKGQVFQRFHERVLKARAQVRNALVYVLNNARKHGSWFKDRPDPYSSGPWFRGWQWRQPAPNSRSPVAEPRTWMMRVGWYPADRIANGATPAR